MIDEYTLIISWLNTLITFVGAQDIHFFLCGFTQYFSFTTKGKILSKNEKVSFSLILVSLLYKWQHYIGRSEVGGEEKVEKGHWIKENEGQAQFIFD